MDAQLPSIYMNNKRIYLFINRKSVKKHILFTRIQHIVIIMRKPMMAIVHFKVNKIKRT